MTLSSEQQKELEPLAIRAYQQISLGFSEEAIAGELARNDIPAAEAEWILKNGRDRFEGYQKYRAQVEHEYADDFIRWGGGVFALLIIVLTFFGWPETGRHLGKAYFGLLLSGGALAYGLWLRIKTDST